MGVPPIPARWSLVVPCQVNLLEQRKEVEETELVEGVNGSGLGLQLVVRAEGEGPHELPAHTLPHAYSTL